MNSIGQRLQLSVCTCIDPISGLQHLWTFRPRFSTHTRKTCRIDVDRHLYRCPCTGPCTCPCWHGLRAFLWHIHAHAHLHVYFSHTHPRIMSTHMSMCMSMHMSICMSTHIVRTLVYIRMSRHVCLHLTWTARPQICPYAHAHPQPIHMPVRMFIRNPCTCSYACLLQTCNAPIPCGAFNGDGRFFAYAVSYDWTKVPTRLRCQPRPAPPPAQLCAHARHMCAHMRAFVCVSSVCLCVCVFVRARTPVHARARARVPLSVRACVRARAQVCACVRAAVYSTGL